MKYYCPECGTVYETKVNMNKGCPLCSRPWEGEIYNLIHIPTYETPEAYEKRTGKPVSDDTAVWTRHIFEGEASDWHLTQWQFAKMEEAPFDYKNDITVIADPPTPPPEDWKGGE